MDSRCVGPFAVWQSVRCSVVVSLSVCVYCSIIDAICAENWSDIDSASATDLPILTTLLSSPAFWSTLHPATVSLGANPVNQQLCPFSIASFGQGQPQVRQAAWALVGSLVGVFKGLFSSLRCRICRKTALCICISSFTFFLSGIATTSVCA